jgi:hypothetical protein
MADESILEASIAHAMNHVLEVERAAEQAVGECRRECEKALEQAREQRLAILERASARMVMLRARISAAIERLAAGASAAVGAPMEADGSAEEHARQREALERLAARLTGELSEQADDEP